ncbi:MAG: hypothetical protein WCJ24_01280 [Candidatus Saccharibacteria bacterium]
MKNLGSEAGHVLGKLVEYCADEIRSEKSIRRDKMAITDIETASDKTSISTEAITMAMAQLGVDVRSPSYHDVRLVAELVASSILEIVGSDDLHKASEAIRQTGEF